MNQNENRTTNLSFLKDTINIDLNTISNIFLQLAPTAPSSTSLLGWFGPAWTTPSTGLHGLVTTEEINTDKADEVTTDFPLLFFTTNAENDIFETTNNQLTTNQSDLNILNKDDIQITEDVHTTAATLISDQGIFYTLLHSSWVHNLFLVHFYCIFIMKISFMGSTLPKKSNVANA